jgi:solute carrier family 50 protein (sugar transporter)
MLYGWTTGSYFPLFATYVFGTMLSTAYVGVYYRWTNAQTYALKAIGAAFVANVLGSVYVVLGMTGVTGQSTDQVELIAGNMMTVACLLPYVAPFETIRTVFKTRSGASIPFGMCLAGATANLIWTIEGLFSKDLFILFLSAACSALGFFQVGLYLAFRPAEKAPTAQVVGPPVSVDKYVLPVKAPAPRLDNGTKASPIVTLIPPRCIDKLDNVSSPALVQVCIS